MSGKEEIWARIEEVQLIVGKMVRYEIRPGRHEVEDLVQDGICAVLKQAHRYAPERASLTTFAHMVARSAILRIFQIEQQNNRKDGVNMLSLDAPVSKQGGSTKKTEIRLGDMIPSGEDMEGRVLTRYESERADELLEQIRDERIRHVIRSRYCEEPVVLNELADQLGVCRERIRQLESEGLRQLRRMMRV